MLTPLLLAWLALPSTISPQVVTHRVSLDAMGLEASGSSLVPSISGDGRYVSFQSDAPLDALASGFTDIYVRDRTTGSTTLLSASSLGGPANSFSSNAELSEDGRFVVFQSDASNLIAGDANTFADVFFVDRDPDENGIYDEGNLALIRVSETAGGVGGNSPSTSPSLSADGRWVSYTSLANNLTPGDTNGVGDVFTWDRLTGTTVRQSLAPGGVQGNGPSGPGQLSSNGRFLAYSSLATNLVASDINGVRDAFLRDRDPDQNGTFDEGNATTIRCSVNDNGAATNAEVTEVDLSGDGSLICFESRATNLAVGTTGRQHVFLHATVNSKTYLLSRGLGGAEANGDSALPVISQNGVTAAFQSAASNLVTGDTNGWDDVFSIALSDGTITRVSVSVPGAQSGLLSQRPSLDSNGDEVAFQSPASDLVPNDSNGLLDVFVRTTGSWSPQLLVGDLFLAQLGDATAFSCRPGENVHFLASFAGTGVGVAPPGLGGLTLDLLSPVINLGTTVADVDGVASYSAIVPNSAPLSLIWLQAVVSRGPGGANSVKTIAIERLIQP